MMKTNVKEKPKPPTYSKEQLKQMRGIKIAEEGGVEFVDVGKWRVRGTEKPYYYVIQIGKDLYTCDCPDFDNRGFRANLEEPNTKKLIRDKKTGKTHNERIPGSTEFSACKHIFAVKFIINKSLDELA